MILPYIFPICAIALLARVLNNKYGYGLAKIPGPTLAAYTDLWRFWLVWGRRPEKTHIALHEKHGPLVRLGPTTVSVSDPEAIKIIYNHNAGLIKVGLSISYNILYSSFSILSADTKTAVGILPRTTDHDERGSSHDGHVQHHGRKVPCQAPASCFQRLRNEYARSI